MNKKNKWFVRIFAGTMVVLMVLGASASLLYSIFVK